MTTPNAPPTPPPILAQTALILLDGEGPSHDAKRAFLLAFYELAATCAQVWSVHGGDGFAQHPAVMVYGPTPLLDRLPTLPGVRSMVYLTDAEGLATLCAQHPETFRPPSPRDVRAL